MRQPQYDSMTSKADMMESLGRMKKKVEGGVNTSGNALYKGFHKHAYKWTHTHTHIGYKRFSRV